MAEPGLPSALGLLISSDLFFTSKVVGTASALGLRCETVPNADRAIERILAGPVACVFCDLADARLNVADLVARLPTDRRPAVVAFGSHVATSRLQEARDAGCTEVLPRSRFSAELPELLRRYLGPTE